MLALLLTFFFVILLLFNPRETQTHTLFLFFLSLTHFSFSLTLLSLSFSLSPSLSLSLSLSPFLSLSLSFSLFLCLSLVAFLRSVARPSRIYWKREKTGYVVKIQTLWDHGWMTKMTTTSPSLVSGRRPRDLRPRRTHPCQPGTCGVVQKAGMTTRWNCSPWSLELPIATQGPPCPGESLMTFSRVIALLGIICTRHYLLYYVTYHIINSCPFVITSPFLDLLLLRYVSC